MLIGICEDRKEDCICIERVCTEIIEPMEKNYEIRRFFDGQDVLECQDKIDLLFLDIEMPRVDGIQVKEQFQKEGKDTMILYVSKHDELMRSAFGIHVYGFIQKCRLKQQMQQILPEALEILQNFCLIEGNVDSRNVVYIKAEHVYSRIVMKDGSERLLRTSLEKFEKQLTRVGFIRTHKSYLVNPIWICKIEGKEVKMVQANIPISVRLRTKVKKEYEEYCKIHARYC